MLRKRRNLDAPSASVFVIGGGFGGVACAKELGKHGVTVTLLDRHNYHEFQPMLYQVATAQLAPSDISRPLRGIFGKAETVTVKLADVASVDPVAKEVTCSDG